MSREASIKRKTGETDIQLSVQLDGEGQIELNTGVPFLEHMLHLFAKHGQFDLTVQAEGDIEVDAHHTTEDIAICLGEAFKRALGSKEGIRRYGSAIVPMDDALAQVVVDLSNRPHLEYRVELPSETVGTFDTELVREFFWKLALEARMNVHIVVHYGHNTHHIIEAIFKACARALREAASIDPNQRGLMSTKGML
ncbi:MULTISPECIES: imidazoleglycerol-phosphate dehydratase HisB [Shouchella]|uniref:Imidazoleglycerol-phosphate dehydratase n=3 Tax=Bacillaceae TaxID=186817 RepID=A0A060M0Q4_9BACI|nr:MULTISPECIES: imidazoleglycerol-phosphate dehydratase HisB [Bacillaceae]RQW21302.1 imidazoleglycerol-phosphate dehydratase HisB [Bacillus sp. C1-1]AIC95580.1 Imidazoleglycerol-phosphate dehydratase [Shouchella lehensis G1]KQL55706.1 imidazoleglycerol-phosphate dehydratase [Alkalicoccobacillus plakortidis]MBG9783712.1 imidazoleglycerol-phosphate dehydratase [Shouchella lehensis]TES51334.1 imidazoleglycerol-phosphate dehydratase HisB [Shouchella lehensis]